MEQMILGRVLGWHMFLSVMLTADLLHGHCFLAYDRLGCWRVNTTCSMIRTANQLTSNGHPPVTCVRDQRLPRIHFVVINQCMKTLFYLFFLGVQKINNRRSSVNNIVLRGHSIVPSGQRVPRGQSIVPRGQRVPRGQSIVPRGQSTVPRGQSINMRLGANSIVPRGQSIVPRGLRVPRGQGIVYVEKNEYDSHWPSRIDRRWPRGL